MASETLESFWSVMDRVKTIEDQDERELTMRAIMLQGFIWLGIGGEYERKGFVEKVEEELKGRGV